MAAYFAFAIADSMFPSSSCASRMPLKPGQVQDELSKGGVISACNPSHAATLAAAKSRYNLNIPPTPEKAPQVSLKQGDHVIVMSVRGLPRLGADRHEYTEAEIASAEFVFGMWFVIAG